MIPLSKTGSVSVNLDDFEFVAIPKRLICNFFLSNILRVWAAARN